jgi:hypothetical protein
MTRLQAPGHGASMSIHMYRRRRPAGPKVQRHDVAVVSPARSAARGPACSIAALGQARGAAGVSLVKPSRSRLLVRPSWPVNGT